MSPPADDPPRNRTPEEGRQVAAMLRDQLDRRPFGDALAAAVWSALMRRPPGQGVIVDFHPEFCGQGLIRTDDGVKLCDVQDGGGSTGPAIATWRQQDDFVDFFARQSDFTCSGWDPSEPIFATDDEWYRNNQRLTRAVLERFLGRRRR
ncbi:MAG TPA: hypothetical protein VJR58_30870 [Vineibacter sp.]|nr:hypothetical protein [Vineibacter sp.]